ncbi:MAG: orotate phosphoribosyltransferase, partial [SAR324 cluster bacterium]|nr:orotate phosphoribosyltransferase [SAR324 cluster bacterium]
AIALSARLNQNIGYFFNRKEKKTHGDQGTLVGQFPLASDSVVMVDDVITDGLTKIESVKLIRELCKVEFSGVLVALDRMEKNSQANDAITEFQQKTGVPVWSIITIREICDYLKNRKIGGSVVLDESTFLKIENYLAEHSVRS